MISPAKELSHLFQAALADGAKLLKELKKLDDKNLLVEVGSAVHFDQIFFPNPYSLCIKFKLHSSGPAPGKQNLPRPLKLAPRARCPHKR